MQRKKPAMKQEAFFLREAYSKGSRAEKISRAAKNYNSIRQLVWKFREANGWKYRNEKHIVPKNYYNGTLGRLVKIRVSQRDQRIIDFLSSEKAIEAVRQRGRMRQKPTGISGREITRLKKEMQAILKSIFMP